MTTKQKTIEAINNAVVHLESVLVKDTDYERLGKKYNDPVHHYHRGRAEMNRITILTLKTLMQNIENDFKPSS